jgi:hypothetical protein
MSMKRLTNLSLGIMRSGSIQEHGGSFSKSTMTFSGNNTLGNTLGLLGKPRLVLLEDISGTTAFSILREENEQLNFPAL